MRSWGSCALALVAALLLGGSASAEICTIGGPGGVQYECPSAASNPKSDPVPWYADPTIQGIIAIVGLAGSASAGGYALYRIRARRRILTQHLTALDTAYQDAKSRPSEGAQRVAALHNAIIADHQKGRIEDGQYLELDKRAKEFLVRLRLLDIDVRFRNLPPAFLAELRHLVGDGAVSQAEADLIEHHAAAYAIPEPARSEIVRLARRWAGEDDPATRGPVQDARATPAATEPITARPRPKILSK